MGAGASLTPARRCTPDLKVGRAEQGDIKIRDRPDVKVGRASAPATMDSHYDSPRIAAAYARDRPPVHAPIVATIAADLGITAPLARALDVGCGAGLSTAALGPIARRATGIDPSRRMLSFAAALAPAATFVAAQAERLPFGAASFPLITAAGSLNHTTPGLALAEAARVLANPGTLAIYDFLPARRMRGADGLEQWRADFAGRYPGRPGYHLDVRGLDYAPAGLRLVRYRDVEVTVAMSLASFLPYVMSETRVEMAIVDGSAEAEIREWCRQGLETVFGDSTREVLFEAYVAYVTQSSALRQRE